MNQTEAWEAVLKAAQLFHSSTPGACVTPEGGKPQKLSVALLKVTPRIKRMRERLDALRARRKPMTNGPEWLRKL
jgi:hypothetical protein